MCASERGGMESPGEEAGRAPPPHTPAQANGSNKIIGRNVNGTSKAPTFLLKLRNSLIEKKRRFFPPGSFASFDGTGKDLVFLQPNLVW